MTTGPLGMTEPLRTLDEIHAAIRHYDGKTIAIAAANHANVLQAAALARQQGIARALLCGPKAEIQALAEAHQLPCDEADIIHAEDDIASAHKAVEAVQRGQADLVMKGYIQTDDFLRAVLAREGGLRQSNVIMSHVSLSHSRQTGKLLMVTDAGMNIAPDLTQKAQIILNALYLANILGIEVPRVGVLAAVEVVNPKMPATLDAAILSKMGQRRQFSIPCLIDGPLAFDNAISAWAASNKHIESDVAGQADILLVPDVESGNMLVKGFAYEGGHQMAGVVIGATVPIVLTSRSSPAEAKLPSMALAALMVGVARDLKLKIGRVSY